ncbi:uncharacterized protein LOC144341481 isoform X1 [Macaca mulatta]
MALGPLRGAGLAAVPSRARAGRVPIASGAARLGAALRLLAMDADDSRAPKGSLRKFLEHLFGARKAIGVLTSGGDAQADAWKGPDGGFPPVSGPRTEQGWSRDGPPAHGPGDLPFALERAGRARVLQVRALWVPPRPPRAPT